MRSKHFASLLVAAALPACIGDLGETGSSSGEPKEPSTPTNFVCDPNLPPETLPLRRLSHVQYTNTVRDLVRVAAGDEADAVIAAVEPLFDQVPDDARKGKDKHYGGFTRLDQAVQQEHVDATYGVAAAVGAELTGTTARLERLAGTCAVDADPANDDPCLDELIRTFGRSALRRPATDEDVAFYRTVAGSAPFEPADYADVVALMMVSPHALYLVEHGAGDGDYVRLDDFELASRLSYHFWQTMPDDGLLAAAESGALSTESGFRAEVDRLFADPRTRVAVRQFFSEWLENTTLEELDSRAGNPVFEAFRGSTEVGPELRERMLEEVVDAATYYTFESGSTFDDFLASDRSFARTPDLAAIYETPVWDGSSEPPVFADPTRVGLVGRAAFLATGSANTRPIMKGVFLRIALLCDDIPPPPPNAAASPPMLSEDSTTRQVVEELTGSGSCAGCHTHVINPLGFVTEGFDALGRTRTEQRFFDEETGAEIGSAPIDSAATPMVDSDDSSVVKSAAELTDKLLASEKPHACFARHYFRFSFGRLEDLDGDACALDTIKVSLDEGAALAESIRAVALSDAFQRRSFVEEDAQ
jgi:hypothetical protein